MKRLGLALAMLALSASVVHAQQTVTIAWDQPAPAEGYEYQGFRVYNSASPVTGHVFQTPTANDLSAVVPVILDVNNDIWVTTYAAKWNPTGVELVESVASNVVSVFRPTTKSPSPDGTLSTSLVDCGGFTWTLSADGHTLRDGVDAGGGRGSIYKLLSCVVWVKGFDLNWWEWNAGWVYTGQWWEPGTPQPIEACAPDGYGNGIDEDRNGQTDEVCAVRPADVTPPTVSLSATADGKSGKWSVSASATDPSGIASITLYAGSTLLTSCTASPCTIQPRLGRGTFTFTAIAVDVFGNARTESRTVKSK